MIETDVETIKNCLLAARSKSSFGLGGLIEATVRGEELPQEWAVFYERSPIYVGSLILENERLSDQLTNALEQNCKIAAAGQKVALRLAEKLRE